MTRACPREGRSRGPETVETVGALDGVEVVHRRDDPPLHSRLLLPIVYRPVSPVPIPSLPSLPSSPVSPVFPRLSRLRSVYPVSPVSPVSPVCIPSNEPNQRQDPIQTIWPINLKCSGHWVYIIEFQCQGLADQPESGMLLPTLPGSGIR